MNGKSSATTSKKKLFPILSFLRLSGNKKWDYVTLGMAGIVVLAFIYIGILGLSRAGQKLQYTPADVVYGKKIHAVHGMDIDRSPQVLETIPANLSEEPVIRVSESFFDFGEVNSHIVLRRTFVIANTGQSALIIQRAYTTCGCTVADFTATEIPPGKVALMTLQFDPGFHEMRGTTVRRGVIIETNDPDHPTQEIWIQASIR
ncbi:DUF1573 domain-containing protein [bacterium]|nr:DUF1573 domain-containing protein [bacterium]